MADFITDKELREYAYKCFNNEIGYTLEKAKLLFPTYYPAIANYYLQLQTKKLETDSLNNRNNLGITLAINIAKQLKAAERQLELLNQEITNNIYDQKQQAFSQFINEAAVPIMAISLLNAVKNIEDSLSKYKYLARPIRSRLGIKQLIDNIVAQIIQLHKLTVTK